MKPLRIGVVMIEPPLPFGSAAGRWYYVLLKGLVERGHRVTAFAACSNAEQMNEARELFSAPEYGLRCYPQPVRGVLASKLATMRRPYAYMFGPELCGDLGRMGDGFDVLHLELVWSGWPALGHARRALVNIHSLLTIDLRGLRGARWRERLHHQLMFRTERRLVRAFRYFGGSSARVADQLRQINSAASVYTLPLGFDASHYPYVPNDQRTTDPVISLVGSMGWYPSYSAAVRLLTRLYPEIKRRVPEVRFEIVGWSARSALREYLHLEGVEIHQDVPDVRPFFERGAVFLYAPVRGSGMKIKVLEAMARGTPVVTTNEGVEGLPAEDGVHASICEDDAGLIERTVALLKDRGLQNRQRRAARELLESHCNPERTLDAVEAIYPRILAVS